MSNVIKGASISEYYFEERCFIKELINSDQLPGLSIAQARVIPGETTVLHQLSSTELYYILSGEGEVNIGTVREPVIPGDIVHIKVGIPQQITNTGEMDLVFLAICTPRFQAQDYEVSS